MEEMREPMRFTSKKRLYRGSTCSALLAAIFAGCASMGGSSAPAPSAAPSPQAAATPAGPPPDIAECGMVSSGSPTRYVCNGKTYTSFQLSKMRDDYNKAQQAQSQGSK